MMISGSFWIWISHETLSVVPDLQDQVLDPGLAAALETTFDTLYFLECRGRCGRRGPLLGLLLCSCFRDGVDILCLINLNNG